MSLCRNKFSRKHGPKLVLLLRQHLFLHNILSLRGEKMSSSSSFTPFCFTDGVCITFSDLGACEGGGLADSTGCSDGFCGFVLTTELGFELLLLATLLTCSIVKVTFKYTFKTDLLLSKKKKLIPVHLRSAENQGPTEGTYMYSVGKGINSYRAMKPCLPQKKGKPDYSDPANVKVKTIILPSM